MKDKEIIEEMAKVLCGITKECRKCKLNGKCLSYNSAELIYNAGYRKIPEDSVVLSREEKQKLLKGMYEQGKFDALADLEKDGKVVLSREELSKDSAILPREKQIENILNIILENLYYGYDEVARALYDANYRKIPKLGVVLPFDHYDNLLKFDSEIRKETAEKFYNSVKEKIEQIEKFYFDNGKIGYNGLTVKELNKLAKQFGVEVEE